MEQTEQIKTLIEDGNKTIEANEKEASDGLEVRKKKRAVAWTSYRNRLLEKLDIAVKEYLIWDAGFDIESSMPPQFLCERNSMHLEIEGLAPLWFYFTANEELDCYVVPAIDVKTLQWSCNTAHWVDGTKILETKDLSLALATAQRHYQIYQRVRSCEGTKAVEKQEPVYVPVVETADQQVINGVRAIVREEIHQLAVGD